MKLSRYMFACCLLLFSSIGLAMADSGLYRAQLAVDSQASQLQEGYFKQAFVQVLIKVSGNPFVGEDDKLIPTSAAIKQSIRQYRYVKEKDQLFLTIDFQPQAIDSLLNAHAKSIWSKDRPTLLTLITVDAEGKREVLGANAQSQPLEILINLAKKYGIPLLLPEMDIDDLKRLSYNDLRSLREDTLLTAEQRYGSDGVLSINITLDEKQQWHSHWTLLWGDLQSDWQINDTDFGQLSIDGLRQLSHDLQVQPTTTLNEELTEQTLFLNVDDIDSSEAYQTVLDYLSSLSSIKHVELINISPQSIRYKIDIRTPLSLFKASLSKDDKLIASSQDDDGTLHYRLNT